MKKFINEFKAFISRGNVMDMAVGIIIGGAFTSIVSSLVEDIINPILGLFGGMNFDQLKLNLLGEVTLNYGKFISAVINFLIMALIVFIMMKAMNGFAEKFKHTEETVEEPKTKICPFCKSEIAIDATRCPHCTSVLEEKEALPQLYREIGESYNRLDKWSMYLITSYDRAENDIGRKADKNRKIYNGMLKTYYYQFLGPKPPRRKKD